MVTISGKDNMSRVLSLILEYCVNNDFITLDIDNISSISFKKENLILRHLKVYVKNGTDYTLTWASYDEYGRNLGPDTEIEQEAYSVYEIFVRAMVDYYDSKN